MSSFKSCSGVIVSASEKILIDTNMGPDETLALLRAEQPDIAIISHYHLDHCTWGPLVSEHTDAELFIPEGEERYLTSLDFFIEKTGGAAGLAREWTELTLDVTGYREIRDFSTYPHGHQFLSDDVTIECVGTPGHSPSHTAFYFPKEKILFTGDMGVDRFGPWYGWTDCDLRELIASILKLRSLDVRVLLTSHGGVVTSGIEKEASPFFKGGLRGISQAVSPKSPPAPLYERGEITDHTFQPPPCQPVGADLCVCPFEMDRETAHKTRDDKVALIKGNHIMKKVLGIVASPRKLGNSEMMIKEIGKSIPIPHELKLLRLADFDIRHCRACYQCLFKEEKCVLKDDLYQVLDAILDADALILAAPTYFLGANALLKLFLDRGLAFYAHIDRLWDKPAVGVGIAGIPGKEGYTLLNIQSFLKLMMTDLKATRLIYGALPGEIFMGDTNQQLAADMGNALFSEPLKQEGPSCPLCGGDTFRFIGSNQVQCVLCSNTGRFETSTDGPVFHIEKGEHEMFLMREDALQHREWLCQMKGRFLEQKKQLKEISRSYLKGWEWVKPEDK